MSSLSQVRAQWDRLSARERRLLSALGACLVACVVISIGWLIADGLRQIEERNADMRQALKDISAHRDEFIRAKMDNSSKERKVPEAGKGLALQGYLEAAAKDLDVTIPEMNERPPQPRGKNYVEKSVDIKLRGVNLQQLAEFMKKTETGSPTVVVVVSRLYVRTRFNQHDQLDVEMTVSTFERGAPEKPKGPGKGKRDEKAGEKT
jgi:type II secretory pathway component PulM